MKERMTRGSEKVDEKEKGEKGEREGEKKELRERGRERKRGAGREKENRIKPRLMKFRAGV